jgi:hypothetical protein
VKFISFTIKAMCTNNFCISWESATVGLEYLFMGDVEGGPNHRHLDREYSIKVDDDFRYLSIGMLKEQPQLNRISGRCN